MPMIDQHLIQARVGLGSDAGTWPLKLPRAGLYTALELVVEWTNGSTSAKDQDIYDELDKIEVVANGSQVIYSLCGHQARLWSHVFYKHRPPYIRDESASAVQRAVVFIPFGLHIFDTEHYLDCARFSDIELRVTFSPTIAATSFATGTGYITVTGFRWVKGTPGAHMGYFKLSEQKRFTSVASGVEPYDLPIGNKYVALGLYVYESGIDPHANIDDVEVSVDYDQFKPFVGEFEVLNSRFTAMMGIDGTEWGRVLKSDTDTIETRTGSVAACSVIPEETITTPGTTDHTLYIQETKAGGLVTMQSMTLDAAVTASIAANTTDLEHDWIAVPKYGLGNFLVLPMGLHNVGMALNSAEHSNVRVNMDQGDAGATCRLSLLELVS